MTPQQLKAAKEILEPLFMIYRLQGYEAEWYEDDDSLVEEGIYITVPDGDIRYTLWIDVEVDEKGQYCCETDSEITWSKLKRLPNQVDYHVREFLKAI